MKLIASSAALTQAVEALRGARAVFLDTEFEATRDGTTLCLLQISAGEEVYLIDALALTVLEPLGAVLAADGVEWVLHAGQQDVPLIMTRAGVKERPRIFDTQVAWALVGPEYSVSLAYLVYRVLGKRSGKSHQADDWRRRPLPAAQLAYAAADVEPLPELHRELDRRAGELGRAEIVREASAEALLPPAAKAGELSLESFRNAWQLDPHGQAALRFMVRWFNALDERARETAPEPKVMLSIAHRLPETGADLSRIKGVPRRFAASYGERFVAELMRATTEANADDFVPIDPPPYATFEEIRLDGFLAHARAEVSAAVGIAPEIAFPGRVIKRMKQAIVQAEGDVRAAADAIEGWRGELLREAYLAYCKRAA